VLVILAHERQRILHAAVTDHPTALGRDQRQVAVETARGTPHLSDDGLRTELAALRQQHLAAIANLLEAIADDRVEMYLSHQFSCPD
jgi:hypothetical protein